MVLQLVLFLLICQFHLALSFDCSSTETPSVTSSFKPNVVLGDPALLRAPINDTQIESICWIEMGQKLIIDQSFTEHKYYSFSRFKLENFSLIIENVRKSDQKIECLVLLRNGTQLRYEYSLNPTQKECKNGGKTVQIFENQSSISRVQCNCMFGYRGENCEQEIGSIHWVLYVMWVFVVLALVLIGYWGFASNLQPLVELDAEYKVPLYQLLPDPDQQQQNNQSVTHNLGIINKQQQVVNLDEKSTQPSDQQTNNTQTAVSQ